MNHHVCHLLLGKARVDWRAYSGMARSFANESLLYFRHPGQVSSIASIIFVYTGSNAESSHWSSYIRMLSCRAPKYFEMARNRYARMYNELNLNYVKVAKLFLECLMLPITLTYFICIYIIVVRKELLRQSQIHSLINVFILGVIDMSCSDFRINRIIFSLTQFSYNTCSSHFPNT